MMQVYLILSALIGAVLGYLIAWARLKILKYKIHLLREELEATRLRARSNALITEMIVRSIQIVRGK